MGRRTEAEKPGTYYNSQGKRDGGMNMGSSDGASAIQPESRWMSVM